MGTVVSEWVGSRAFKTWVKEKLSPMIDPNPSFATCSMAQYHTDKTNGLAASRAIFSAYKFPTRDEDLTPLSLKKRIENLSPGHRHKAYNLFRPLAKLVAFRLEGYRLNDRLLQAFVADAPSQQGTQFEAVLLA